MANQQLKINEQAKVRLACFLKRQATEQFERANRRGFPNLLQIPIIPNLSNDLSNQKNPDATPQTGANHTTPQKRDNKTTRPNSEDDKWITKMNKEEEDAMKNLNTVLETKIEGMKKKIIYSNYLQTIRKKQLHKDRISKNIIKRKLSKIGDKSMN